ncbi:hypothetical protein GGR57DRAFT_506617 [Xylariaceae sp. FL1272]|nr:hypothetical protein GGR57DRAFT_506617 [Xylariaceae sp. FL1272]
MARGPREQQELDELTGNLTLHKNTLCLFIVANLLPAGKAINIKDVKMDQAALLNSGPIIRTPGDKDYDHVRITNVTMSGISVLNTTATTPEERGKFLDRHDARVRKMQDEETQRAKTAELLKFAADMGVDAILKEKIVQIYGARWCQSSDDLDKGL